MLRFQLILHFGFGIERFRMGRGEFHCKPLLRGESLKRWLVCAGLRCKGSIELDSQICTS